MSDDLRTMTLWRHRDFRRLWAGETVSELGTQVSVVAIPLVAVRSLHASAFQVGTLTALSTAAFLLIGLPAGAWVDRLTRRRVMIVADVGRLVAFGSIPLAYAIGHLGLVHLYVVAFLAGVLTVFFDVAYQSYLPFLVGTEHLVEGNAKLAGSAQAAQVAGPSLAGGLVQAIGGPLAVALDAASFGASALGVGLARAREQPVARPAGVSLRSDVGEGLRFVFGHPILRAIAATTATSNLFSSMVVAVQVVFLVRTLHLAPAAIGLIFATGGVGGVVGALTSHVIAARIGGVRATFAGIAATAGGLLMPAATRGTGALLFAVGYFWLGFGSVLYNVNQVSFRQRLCPPRLLGRMNATMRFVVWGVMPVGALLGGGLASAVGLRQTLWVATIGGTLAITWLIASPLRQLRDYPAG